MELYQLEYFRAVATHQNFTLAASAMNVSQPTISIAVQKLERELGVQLLEKKDKPITLTPVGHAILDRVGRVLMEVENIQKEVVDFQDGAEAVIRFGIPLTLCNDIFPQVKSNFPYIHPNIKVLISQYGVEILEPELAAGNLDLCILSDKITRPEVDYVPYGKSEMYVCFSVDHPFDEFDCITPAMLADEDLLVAGHENGVSRYIYDYLEEHDALHSLTLDGLYVPQSMLQLASEGMGVTFLEKNYAQSNATIKCRPMNPPMQVTLVIAWNKNKFTGRALKTFISYLKKLK